MFSKIGVNFNGDLPKGELLNRVKIIEGLVNVIWIGDLEPFEDPIKLADFF